MLKPVFAFLLLATSPIAATAQNTSLGQWKLANASDGCMVHATSRKGTVLSISAMPGEDSLLFVVQSRQLSSLRDGERYGIEVEFDDMGEWQIAALAQTSLDSDGPGLIFAVRPGREDGANFLKEFASASGMQIGHDGAALDTLPLSGGTGAMSALATCLSQKWPARSGAQGQGGPLIEVADGEEAVPL
ncbi:MAG TPA: hypothetical protein VNT77_00650 [Allosphingosinicella sp.]|nr:hypothetical protein [Allosphingosinicella sp.]